MLNISRNAVPAGAWMEDFATNTRLHELLSGPGAKPEFNCDAYPVLVLPEEHPEYEAVTGRGRRYCA